VWKWIWPRVGSTPISQNTDSEMFDRTDYPYTETFVREAIQNTLDARLDPARPAVISFKFHRGSAAAVRDFVGEAIDLRRQAALRVPSEWDRGEIDWLCIEDFNTKGLDGDLGDRLGNFWNYWLNFGLSNKDGHGRGGRGIGRVTFLIASRVQTVLGITRRMVDDVTAASGMVLLRAMRTREGLRSTHAYLAAAENQEHSIFRLHDGKAFHSAVVQAFKLAGYTNSPNTSGLALAIPYPHEELTPDGILASSIEHFAPAILNGSLIVRVDDHLLDRGHIDAIAASVAERMNTGWLSEDVGRYLSLIRSAQHVKPQILDVDIKKDLTSLRDRPEVIRFQKALASEQTVVFALRFDLTRGAATRKVILTIAAARTPESLRPIDRLFREGMSLPDVKSNSPGEIDAVILVDDDELATYLNFCEGKAHLDLLESKEVRAKLEEKGYRPLVSVKRFVKSLPAEMRKLLTPDITEPEIDVFDAFFSLPDTDAGKRKGPGGKPDVNPPPPPAPKFDIFD